MNCPYCNQIMEEGYILSTNMIMFSKKKKLWKSLGHRDVRLTNGLTNFHKEAYKCNHCRKIILEYAEKDVY